MQPSDKAEPRKRQIEGWRQVAQRTAAANRRARKPVGIPTRPIPKEK